MKSLNFRRESAQRGASLVEYALLLACVSLVSIYPIKMMSTSSAGSFQSVVTELEVSENVAAGSEEGGSSLTGLASNRGNTSDTGGGTLITGMTGSR